VFLPFGSMKIFVFMRTADAGGASLHAIGLYRRLPADSSRRAYYFRMIMQAQARTDVPRREAPEL
jgi:hypothetical protein